MDGACLQGWLLLASPLSRASGWAPKATGWVGDLDGCRFCVLGILSFHGRLGTAPPAHGELAGAEDRWWDFTPGPSGQVPGTPALVPG